MAKPSSVSLSSFLFDFRRMGEDKAMMKIEIKYFLPISTKSEENDAL